MSQLPPQVSGEVVMELLTQRWDLADTGAVEVRTHYDSQIYRSVGSQWLVLRDGGQLQQRWTCLAALKA